MIWFKSAALGMGFSFLISVAGLVVVTFLLPRTTNMHDYTTRIMIAATIIWLLAAYIMLVKKIPFKKLYSLPFCLLVWAPVTVGCVLSLYLVDTQWYNFGMLFSSVLLFYEYQVLQGRQHTTPKNSS